MPLIKSGSKEALSENIATEREAGKPEKQAVAIGLATQRANDETMEPSLVLSNIHEQNSKWHNP